MAGGQRKSAYQPHNDTANVRDRVIINISYKSCLFFSHFPSHHRTNLDKYHPGYFGKVGMRYVVLLQCLYPRVLKRLLILNVSFFHKTNNPFWKPTINLEKVSLMVQVSVM